MFLGVGLGVETEAAGAGQDPGRLGIDGGGAERRLERAVGPDGRAFETDVVGRAEDDDGLVVPPLNQLVAEGGDAAGIDISGVGDDQGPDSAGDRSG